MTSPSSEVEQLRRKIQQGWAAMEGGEGGGGSLLDERMLDEGSEIEKLSRQLSYQTELNNELLKQVHDLELEHLAFQKDSQEKKTALRQALAVCEQLKGDMMDLKRKNVIYQEQTQKSLDEANQARLESGLKQREIDNMKTYLEQAKEEVAMARQDRDDIKRDAERAIRDQKELREELEKIKDDEAVRAAERRADMDSMARDLNFSKTKVGPLEAELKAEKLRAQELTEALNKRTEELKTAQQQYGNVRNLLNQQKEQADRAAAAEKQLQQELETKLKQLSQNDSQVQAASDLVAAMESELRDSQRIRQELEKQKKDLENELRDCKSQLDLLANDLHTQANGRRQDRERLESRLNQLQADLEAKTLEARSVGKSFADGNSKKEQEFAETRKMLEDSKSRLQNENARLNDLLLGTQREMAAKLQDFQQEREAYEERLADSTRKQRAAESHIASRDLSAGEETTKLREKVLEAQQQLGQRTRLHVDTLGALEATIHKLTQECQRLQAAHDGLLDEVGLMQRAMRDYVERGNAPIEEWHADSKRSMVSLVEACEVAEQEARDARESQLHAESQRDEEKNRTFMLEEERSRLEDDLKTLEDRYRQLETKTAEKVRQAKAEADAAIAARADLEALSRRVQDQLERANGHNRAIQEDLERSNLSLNEAQFRAREKINMLDEKAAKLESIAGKAEAERDAALAELALLKKKLEANAQEIENLNRDLRSNEEATRGAGLKESREIQEYQKKVATLSETIRKHSVQLGQERNLNKVVQEQKKHLLEENLALKAELDERASRSLQGMVKDAGVQFLEGENSTRRDTMSTLGQ